MSQRPIVLVTGASRSIGIGSSIARELAQSGWDVALTYWWPYDASMPWGSDQREVQLLRNEVESFSVRSTAIEVDLSLADSAEEIFDIIKRDLGAVTAIVMAHCHSVDSDILSTSVESFDLHLASAQEFRSLGITANVINPGATDTGWMSAALKTDVQSKTLLNRVGIPQDCANLVKFLCSKEGGWINGQLLYSNGGLQ